MDKGEMRVKNVLIGGFLLASGILLYIGVQISTVIFMTDGNGWSTPPGRYGTALEQIEGQMEVNTSIVLCILGIGFMMWEGIMKPIIKRYRNRPPK